MIPPFIPPPLTTPARRGALLALLLLIAAGLLIGSLVGLAIVTRADAQQSQPGSAITITPPSSVNGGAGAVTSVFGRVGAVVAAANDYTFQQIANITGLIIGGGAGAPSAYAGTSGAAHQYLTGLNLAGVGVYAQPSTSDLSDIGTFNLNTTGTGALANLKLTSTTASNNAILDVDSVAGFATASKHGATNPVYLLANSPIVGFSAYFGSGAFRYGKGAVGNYAGTLSLGSTTGTFTFAATAATGNADAAATLTNIATLDKSGNWSVIGGGSYGTTPTAPTAATGDNTTKLATTAYVTTAVANAVAAVNPAVAVQAATTAPSDTSGLAYFNGVAGIGATFTGSVNTALVVDGFTFTALNQRLLVKNDTQSPSGAFNGIYYVTQLQTGILPPILTRALDYDAPSDINNTGAIPVVNGTVNGTTSWLVTSTVNTVGTDPLTFTKFSTNPAATDAANTMRGNWTGSAAAPVANAMPSCTDSAGNHLNYVAGTGITCGTSSSASGGGLYNQVLSATPTSANTGFTTWLNQGAASVADVATGVTITAPSNASVSFKGRTKAPPATPYVAKFLISLTALPTNYVGVGVGWYDGTNKLHLILLEQNTGWAVRVEKWTSPTGTTTTDAILTANNFTNLIWFQVADDGTNATFSLSYDGVNYVPVYTVAKSAGYLGASGYTNLVWGVSGLNSLTYGTLLSYSN